MNRTPRSVPLPSDAAAMLAAASAAHRKALKAAARAGDLRAVAVWNARRDGATWGQLSLALGIPRPDVVPLARRGAALCGFELETPDPALALRVTAAKGPTPELEEPKMPDCELTSQTSTPGPEETPATTCRREGCDVATEGTRFCPLHLFQ